MEGVAALLDASSHSESQPSFGRTSTLSSSTRKRKPLITYQSPDSGVLDMALLIRNTALEFEAAAILAAASRSTNNTQTSLPYKLPSSSSTSSSSSTTLNNSPDASSNSTSSESASIKHIHNVTPAAQSRTLTTITTTRRLPIPPSFRPVTLIPRAPHPLYHPLSQPSSSKHGLKNGQIRYSETGTPSAESGRRSSSRTRRPAPKVRETENTSGSTTVKDVTLDVSDKPSSPTKRRRGGVGGGGGGGGKRKRAGQQQEADVDSAYPAVKRSRKQPQRDKTDGGDVVVGGDGDVMPPPPDTSPPSGYSTRARRPRTVAPPPVNKDDSATSDGTGSVTRTTPVNGAVEEFWVPTKSS